MAVRKYGAHINLQQNELQNAVVQNLATAPSNPKVGQEYYDTTANQKLIWNGTSWVDETSQGDYTFQNGIELVTNTRNVQLKLATGANAGNVTFTANSNGLAGSVTELSIDSGSADYLTISNHKLSANVDTTVAASSSNLITSGAVSSAIATALTGALKYQGTWTATSQTDYSSITLPVKKGYMYAVSGSATVDGVEWNAGDYLVINKDIAAGGIITSADVDKIDNTEASDIVRLSATQTLTNKTIAADDNTITDLEIDNFKSGVVRTSSDGIRASSSASDTALATEKAIATAIEDKKASFTNPILSVSGGVCTWTISTNLAPDCLCNVKETSTGSEVYTDVTYGNGTITVKINSSADIPAGTYTAIVLG
jgi:hypothetical protein